MAIVYFDSGTTNTRAYLIRPPYPIINQKILFGSKDVSMSNEPNIFAKTLYRLYENILREVDLSDNEIKGVYASGMVTSPYGFRELEHIILPVDAVRLEKSIIDHEEKECFHRTIRLIPGVKTRERAASWMDLANMNNMRGEEIQAIGISEQLFQRYGNVFRESTYAILFPGSHTHCAIMNGETIVDVLSMFSGELFHSLTHATVLASEVSLDQEKETQEEIVLMGCHYLQEYGIARALYLVHTSRIFQVGDGEDRRDLLNGMIAGCVAQSLSIALRKKWPTLSKVVLCGSKTTIKPYECAVSYFTPNMEVVSIDEVQSEVAPAVDGLLKIIDRGDNNSV